MTYRSAIQVEVVDVDDGRNFWVTVTAGNRVYLNLSTRHLGPADIQRIVCECAQSAALDIMADGGLHLL